MAGTTLFLRAQARDRYAEISSGVSNLTAGRAFLFDRYLELVNQEQLVTGLIYYVVFLFSTTVHEAAHAWAAKLGGDLTAYHGGQVSLDPRPHIQREPFGMVVLPLISTLITGWPFGYASAPYDPHWAMRHPRRAAWMALAGPGSNLALVVLSIIVIRIGMLAGGFYAPDSARFGLMVGAVDGGLWRGAAGLTSMMFSMNLVLACLNILPLPPLDGSAAVVLFLSESSAQTYQQFLWTNPMLGAIGMLVAWRAFDVVFDPIFWTVVSLIYPGTSYS